MDEYDILLNEMKNPLRKQDLANRGRISNKEYVDSLVSKGEKALGADVRKEIQRLKGSAEEQEKLKQSKIKEFQDNLKTQYLKTTVNPAEYDEIFNGNGIKYFIPKRLASRVTPMFMIKLKQTHNRFVNEIKDILPIKKPRVIITDTHPELGSPLIAGGLYWDKLIWLNIAHAYDPNILIHEYAHYIADLVPSEFNPILQFEYKKMLDNYFSSAKKKKREDLNSPEDERRRELVAKKLGFPSPYGMKNFDEFFAEIIAYWKKIPNNSSTYRFKQIAKKVISRL